MRDRSAALTPEQKLLAAYAVLVCNVDQHAVAALYAVNSGRVNEAVQAARAAFGYPTKENNSRSE